MIRLAPFVFFISLLSFTSYSKNMTPPDNQPFEKEWKTVDSLENKGLYRQALEKVEAIFNLAVQKNEHSEAIKSVLFQLRYNTYLEEDDLVKGIAHIDKLIETANSPSKEILHSLSAEVYWGYYSRNEWQFRERTNVPDLDESDIRTWDLRKIAEKVVEHYELSLANFDQTSKAKLVDFDEILSDGFDKNTLESRPTIYDFLVHRALDFYSENEFSLPGSSETFAVDKVEYLKSYNSFKAVKISESKDELNTTALAFDLFQEASKKRSLVAPVLFGLELKRLQFALNKSIIEDKEQIYVSTLKTLEDKYLANAFSTEATFLMAQQYSNWAGKYDLKLKKPEEYRLANQTALKLCNEALSRFPDSYGAKQCNALKASILRKELSLRSVEANPVNENILLQISFKNLDKVHLKIVKYDHTKRNIPTEQLEKILSKSDGTNRQEINLPKTDDYRLHATEIALDGLSYGFYYIVVSEAGDFNIQGNGFSYIPIWITDLTFQSRNSSGSDDQTILVSDRTTGKPIQGAKVRVTYQKYNYVSRKYVDKLLGVFTTRENGQVSYKTTDKSYYYNISVQKGADLFDPNDSHYGYRYNSKTEKVVRVNLFTDRKIYRPGQKVFFKGITIEYKDEDRKLLADYTTNVIIYDANYQKIYEQEVTTNEFGSFQGEFTIPTGILTGLFRIQSGTSSQTIRVEEYKRPKFSAEMNPVEGEFQLNDSIEVTGRAMAFAGNPIDGAEVKYRVVRTVNYPSWLWRPWFSYGEDKEIELGEVTTEVDGSFSFKFKALPDVSIPASRMPMFTYRITATITDINGETHDATQTVTVGYQSLQLNNNLSKEINRADTVLLVVKSTNLNGQKIKSTGTFTIARLKQPKNPLVSRLWDEPDVLSINDNEFKKKFPYIELNNENNRENWEVDQLILTQNFDTEKQDTFELSGLVNWTPGTYRYEAISMDKNGVEVKDIKFFTIFSIDSKESAINDFFWMKLLTTSAQPGDTVELLISSTTTASVTYEIEGHNEILQSEVLEISNEQKLLKIPVSEVHRGNFTIHLSLVNQNRQFTQSIPVSVPYKNKQLDLKFTTFRNKLLPGAKEEWTLSIKNKAGEKESAELLATLYDASLDELYMSNSFYMNIYPYFYGYRAWGQSYGSNLEYSRNVHRNWNDYVSYPSREYPQLNYYGYSGYRRTYYLYDAYSAAPMADGVMETESMDLEEVAVAGNVSIRKSKAERLAGGRKDAATRTLNAPSDDDFDNRAQEQGQVDKVDLTQVKARTNFNETAFFYPQLHTDSEGNVSIKFTIPESLTKWKFNGLAHTKDLKIGTITETVVTQKELMVVPNVPRFLREGDEIILSTKISNLSENNLAGEAQLLLLDPETDEVINDQFNLTQTAKLFTSNKGESRVVSWKISVPNGLSLVKYRFVAAAGIHSDGEENVLPILSNRMLVTESLPLPIRGKESKNFEFKKLIDSKKSKSLEQHRFTLEFTSNPAWYAVQAMPYMMEYPYECAEQTFTRYYSNAIATHLMNSNPKIREVIEKWGEDSPEAFYSNLQKNEELKSVLIQETPWVLDAKNEEESKRNLATLLDLNRMEKELDKALKKTLKAQSINGGWPWFPGMKENRYITQHIVTGMGHLDHLGIHSLKEDERVKNMLDKAVKYLDEKIVEDYRWAKKYDKDYLTNKHIGYSQIQYFYARSYFKDVKMDQQTLTAVNYYKDQAKKYWKDFSLAGEAMLALGANRMDMSELATDIYKSLKDRSIQSEEFGMYWKEYKAGYYWYQAPIETQALMIELFDEVGNDFASVEELKIWLLKQKQTTNWKTTKQTTEAVYALLLRGSDLLASDELVQVKLNNQPIIYVDQPSENPFEVNSEAGTGYFKTAWEKDEVQPEFGNITVSKSTDGVAWGAAYWQYFEDLDKITFAETNLKLKKQLFKVVIGENGEELQSIKSKSDLKVGELVRVRIELRSDRNLEYVHMKDMRAAGFEPVNVLSRYHFQDGLGYYQATKDASTNFFFDYIPKGTYVFEYDLRVQHAGEFSNGITTIQCMYAPEFTSHSEGVRVKVEEKK